MGCNENVSEVNVQVIVGLALVVAVGANPRTGKYAIRDSRVSLDLLFGVEPVIANPVDIGRAAPAVHGRVVGRTMRGTAVAAVRSDMHKRSDSAPEQLEVRGQDGYRARNVPRIYPYRLSLTHVDYHELPELEVFRHRRFQGGLPGLDLVEKTGQATCAAVAVQ